MITSPLGLSLRLHPCVKFIVGIPTTHTHTGTPFGRICKTRAVLLRSTHTHTHKHGSLHVFCNWQKLGKALIQIADVVETRSSLVHKVARACYDVQTHRHMVEGEARYSRHSAALLKLGPSDTYSEASITNSGVMYTFWTTLYP